MFNTHLCCRPFLQLLDRFSVTLRQVGQEAGVCACVQIQTRHHVNSLSEDQGTRLLHQTLASTYHRRWQTHSAEQLARVPVGSDVNSSRCSNFLNLDVADTTFIRTRLFKYWSTALSIEVITSLFFFTQDFCEQSSEYTVIKLVRNTNVYLGGSFFISSLTSSTTVYFTE